MTQHHALLQAALAGTRQDPLRYSAREIKWVATMDVARLQEQTEDVAKKIRELNGQIQETNWKVELEH